MVVTLGNFATKYVLQTQQGITRMRGSVYPWHGRKVIPTFHPAAILHGGGEKSRQFGELQEDFALIKRTLDRAGDRSSPPRPAARDVARRAGARDGAGGPRRRSWSCSDGARSSSDADGRGHARGRAPRSRRSCARATSSSSPVSSARARRRSSRGSPRGLGATEHVTSPTFTLVREYVSGRVPLAHVDLYRLEREQDVIDLALDELEDGERVLLVEWGEPVGGSAPEDRLRVELDRRDPTGATRPGVSGRGDRRLLASDGGADGTAAALERWPP